MVASQDSHISEFTKTQIIDWSGVSPEKVWNVGCGVDPEYQPDGDSYGLPFSYFLSVSNRKRHKNEFRIVEAFARANLDPRIHLVFTGDSAPGCSLHKGPPTALTSRLHRRRPRSQIAIPL